MRIGLREAKEHFSKAIKAVKAGRHVPGVGSADGRWAKDLGCSWRVGYKHVLRKEATQWLLG